MWQVQAKTKILNNFLTERHRQEMSTVHLHEIGVEESSGDVISDLPPLQ
jgi:hypothetical protein